MTDPRIIAITLDGGSILRRSPAVEREREVAVSDLLAANRFAPSRDEACGHGGPWAVTLRVMDGRLAIDLAIATTEAPLRTVLVPLARFKRPIRDYFAIVDSHLQALGAGTPHGLEAIDMARRGIHNDAATLLQECLAPKIAVDFDTARRLFTLLCVLHIRA